MIALRAATLAQRLSLKQIKENAQRFEELNVEKRKALSMMETKVRYLARYL